MTAGGAHLTSIRWPVEVDARLDELVAVACEASSRRVSRTSVLAAMVCAAPDSGAALCALVEQYEALDLATINAAARWAPPLGRPRGSRVVDDRGRNRGA